MDYSNKSDEISKLPANDNSVIAITEFQLPIIMIPDFRINSADFPIEDFFNLPFSHHIVIFSKIKDLEQRYFYIHKAVQEHLSVNALSLSIKCDDFQHQKEIANNFASTLPTSSFARRAVEMFKDEYLLDFINIEEIGERDIQDIDEKVKKAHENPTIGIVLCKTVDKDFAEYVIQDYNKPMEIATYKTLADMPKKMQDVMPDIEELKKLLQSDNA